MNINNNYTNTRIDFLYLIDKSISIEKSGKTHYFKIYEWKVSSIQYFLSFIRDNEVYTVFPFISTSGLIKDPYLRLSEPFLVTNKSNQDLINNFLNDQWFDSAFTVEDETRFNLYFKFQRVTISSKTF